MISFRAKSKIIVLEDPVEFDTLTTGCNSKIVLNKRSYSEDKENIDPVRKILLKGSKNTKLISSKNWTGSSGLRNSMTRHAPSPLADITEAYNGSYVSPLPLSTAYTVGGMRVAKKNLKQQQTCKKVS
ncbi:hypothetical protein K7432_006149 [Basidiobolus ranarum]|uniref:Uncharacterized protein n=1 Tax=Basidiobolus ranarum TaxID=34480 RepID=A0ABR2W249_9FUNG